MEALAAMVVLVMAGVFTLLAIRGASRATIRVQNTDQATVFAYDMLDRARAFGCGTEVFNEERLGVRLTNCGGTSGELGAAEFVYHDEQGREFNAEVITRWGRSDRTPMTTCAHLTAADGPKVSNPNILVRTVTVDYPLGHLRHSRSLTVVESVPPDAIEYNSQVRGGIVLRGATPITGSARITNGSGQTIRRYADGSGCVWFPFIPAGSRQVQITGGPTITVNVPLNGTVCRNAGGGAC